MNVLLFTCVSGRLFQRAIGAYQLAGFLREHGYTVQVVDFTDEFSALELKAVIDKYISAETLAIGISSTFYSELGDKFIAAEKTFEAIIPDDLEAAVKYAKGKYPALKIVFGGSRSLAGEFTPWVDCVIHGYGEDKFLNYLNVLSGKGARSFNLAQGAPSKIITAEPLNCKFNVQTLSHKFAVQDFLLPGETLPIEISRGCIFKCKFCAYPLNGKKKLDYLRDAELVREELMHNYELYKTTNYFIGDDTFNDSTFKLEELHRVITSLPFKIKFTCYLRLDLLYKHQEQIKMLDEMGLASPFFGIESLNQKSATAIGKGMNVNKVKDFLLELYHNHWRAEKPFTCSFIIGLPHETPDTIAETFNWVKGTQLSSVFFGLSISIKSFYQSEFNKNYKKYGYDLKNEDTGYWENEHFNYTSATALADKLNSELMYVNDWPSSWFLMTLLNHGLSLDEARQTLVKDLSWRRLLRSKKQQVQDYKHLVLGH